MRKEDRVLQQKNQNPPKQHGDPHFHQKPNEPVRAKASAAEPAKPPRQPGKLPLPD
jgi:hypothetical protein